MNFATENLLEVRGLRKVYGHGANKSVALERADFTVARGTTLGIVGESGSGKSTTAACVLQLTRPTSGSVKLGGRELIGLSARQLRSVRRQAQIIFQDPYESLDPKMTVEQLIAEPLQIHGIGSLQDRRERVALLLEQVGMDPVAASRMPQQFSGGQRQRIGIARALALKPSLIVCDESVSALDVSVQAQILNLLRDLQDELGLTYLFISHDLAVVKAMSDELVVMRHGRIVESGSARELFAAPREEYTRDLMAAIPLPIVPES